MMQKTSNRWIKSNDYTIYTYPVIYDTIDYRLTTYMVKQIRATFCWSEIYYYIYNNYIYIYYNNNIYNNYYCNNNNLPSYSRHKKQLQY